MSQLDKHMSFSRTNASNNLDFVQYFEGYDIEDTLRYIRACRINNLKYVYVVSFRVSLVFCIQFYIFSYYFYSSKMFFRNRCRKKTSWKLLRHQQP